MNVQNAPQPVIREYEGNNISFIKEDNIMVNATEMARPFAKRVYDWLITQQSKDFISALSETRNLVTADLVKVTKGGDPKLQGTWLHEDVALEFARWLSPKFAIWCNDQIKTLLTTGSVALNLPQTYQEALRMLADKIDENERQQRLLAANRPKVEFFDAVADSKTAISMNDVAKVLGFPCVGRNKLFQILREHSVLMPDNRPYQTYIDRGYFRVIEQHYQGRDGMPQISFKTLVYQKGVDYIRSKMQGWGYGENHKAI